jgi:hypothetical protein
MALTSNQRKELRAALLSAFPEQSRLPLMVEDELDEEFNLITQGQTDYELVIRDLVRWADSQGRLRELVIGASKKNPGNPELKTFSQVFIDNALHKLFSLLSLINFDTVSNAYQSCYEGRRRETPTTLVALIARLNEIPGESDETKPLWCFVKLLIQEQSLASDQQQALRTWAEEQGISLDIATSEPEIYLMVKVQPRSLNDPALGYLVSATIVKDPAPHQLDAEVMQFPIAIPILPDSKSAPGYTENDLPCLLDTLITICGKDHGVPLTDLTVQWFLPIGLMNLPVEHWQIRIGRREHCNGGRCRAVIIRSFDRHFLPDYQVVSGDWKKYWRRLVTCLDSHSTQALETLDLLTGCTEIAWNKAQVVGCRFIAHSNQQQQEDLWDDLLSQGLPIALWMRQPGTSTQDGATVMQAVIDRPLRELPLSLTEQRRAALTRGTNSTQTAQPDVAHLSLLWDNPFRPFPTINYQSA